MKTAQNRQESTCLSRIRNLKIIAPGFNQAFGKNPTFDKGSKTIFRTYIGLLQTEQILVEKSLVSVRFNCFYTDSISNNK